MRLTDELALMTKKTKKKMGLSDELTELGNKYTPNVHRFLSIVSFIIFILGWGSLWYYHGWSTVIPLLLIMWANNIRIDNS